MAPFVTKTIKGSIQQPIALPRSTPPEGPVTVCSPSLPTTTTLGQATDKSTSEGASQRAPVRLSRPASVDRHRRHAVVAIARLTTSIGVAGREPKVTVRGDHDGADASQSAFQCWRRRFGC